MVTWCVFSLASNIIVLSVILIKIYLFFEWNGVLVVKTWSCLFPFSDGLLAFQGGKLLVFIPPLTLRLGFIPGLMCRPLLRCALDRRSVGRLDEWCYLQKTLVWFSKDNLGPGTAVRTTLINVWIGWDFRKKWNFKKGWSLGKERWT